MKNWLLLIVSGMIGCSSGSANFVHVTADGQHLPFIVECSPAIKNCKQLIIDTCHCTDYVVESRERVSFQTYRMEVYCN